jgi:hypothetical protein
MACKEAVVSYFEVLSVIYLDELRKSPGRDLNQLPPEYEVEMLSTRLRRYN